MSAIALLLARMGHTVSGSDIKDVGRARAARGGGVDVHVGNRAEHVPADADAVVYSTAIPRGNVELVAAARARHPGAAPLGRAGRARRDPRARSRSRARTARPRRRRCSRSILRGAGWQPSFVIGGEVNEVGTNAAYGDGEWLVVEADESDGTFLQLAPEAAIVTNVEPDHLDHYGGFDALVAAFERFVDGVPRPGRVLRRRPGRRRASPRAAPDVRTYGVDAERRLPDRRRSRRRPRRLPLHARGRRRARSASSSCRSA